jgi:hypothetical protein
MSKELMINLLTKGNNGEEILQILDTITGGESADDTLMSVTEELEF